MIRFRVGRRRAWLGANVRPTDNVTVALRGARMAAICHGLVEATERNGAEALAYIRKATRRATEASGPLVFPAETNRMIGVCSAKMTHLPRWG